MADRSGSPGCPWKPEADAVGEEEAAGGRRAGVKVAIGGKGGTGKTTVAGTLARALARAGRAVVAMDADSNPNLHAMLGFTAEQADAIEAIPRDLLETIEENGQRRLVLGTPAAEVIDRYAGTGPDGVRLIIGGRVGHAGAG